ncbi:MAG: hypothetical protein ABEJ85_00335 [Haloarculaceae archaeon]
MPIDTDERVVREDSDTILGVDRAEFVDVLQTDESLTVGDVFADEFVAEYSAFDSFGAFVSELPADVDSVADLEGVPRADLDEHVAAHTTFDDWPAMVRAGCEEYVQRRTTY